MNRHVGEVVEFYIIPGVWRIGIIESLSQNTSRYNIRFIRLGEPYHNYYYCREEEVRDAIYEPVIP